jgi:hypothetical protein
MNIIESVKDKNLFHNYLGESLDSWENWLTALKTMYGLPAETEAERKLIVECTGRDPSLLPESGFQTSLLLVGRRSGKSRIAGLTAAFEAALSGREKLLSPGEIGLVVVVSPTKFQSRIVRRYIRACFAATPILRGEIIDETKESFVLKNGVEIHSLVADYRSVRGFSLLSCIVDEVCFLDMADENKIKSDVELIQALRPGLANTQGRMVCIGSPYSRRGWAYSTWKKSFGNDDSKTLTWVSPSRLMNPTLSEQVVNDALQEDPAAAKAEYLAQWRDDVAAFISRATVESLVVQGRGNLPYSSGIKYAAFCDVSGGRSDNAAISIAHKEGHTVIIDYLEEFKAPNNPYQCVAEMTAIIKSYGLDKAVGDAYAAEFSRIAF